MELVEAIRDLDELVLVGLVPLSAPSTGSAVVGRAATTWGI
jgi:hypothetical protein